MNKSEEDLSKSKKIQGLVTILEKGKKPKHLLHTIYLVEEGLSKGKELKEVCQSVDLSSKEYRRWKKQNKNLDLHVSVGLTHLEKEKILEKRNQFKRLPGISRALEDAEKLGVDPEKIVDLCMEAYFSEGRLDRLQVENDLNRLKKAEKLFKKTANFLRGEAGKPWKLTEWTKFRIKDELIVLGNIQPALEDIANKITSFSESVKFPGGKPHLWEDVTTVFDGSASNKPNHYLDFNPNRAHNLILKLATLFRGRNSYSNRPQDPLAWVLVSGTMNANSKKKVNMDLETYSKLRRSIEKKNGVRFKKYFKRDENISFEQPD
jgi:hypothetical protein